MKTNYKSDWELTKRDGTLICVDPNTRTDIIAKFLLSNYGFDFNDRNYVAMKKLVVDYDFNNDFDSFADVIREEY